MAAVCSLIHIIAAGAQTDGTQTTANSVNDFAWNLYAQFANESGNLFFSPFSISSALTLTSAGAKGATLEEMRLALRQSGTEEQIHGGMAQLVGQLEKRKEKEGGLELVVANRLWGPKDEAFVPTFLERIKTSYNSGVGAVDFIGDPDGSRLQINQWVSDVTRTRIKDLLKKSDVTPSTRLVITNAIYFKGDWALPFNSKLTKKGKFSVLDGGKVEVPFMSQMGRFAVGRGEDCHLVELPYQGGEFSMVILLPDKVDGIKALQSTVSAKNLDVWLGGMKKELLGISLPKFKFEWRGELQDPLKSMGMKLAMSPDADFSGMCSGGGVSISKVIHQAYVAVDEKGTEAAAATAVLTEWGGMKASFLVNHPFLFVIRHRHTGALLFVGRVVNPAK